MSITLYVEGGGDSKALRTRCRRGFRKFFEKAGLGGRMPRISACGGRREAYRRFRMRLVAGDRIPMLLVDAEGPFTTARPWQHLRNRDQWDRPSGAGDDHCHLMVQIMESWFLADKSALKSFYGQRFQAGALPGSRKIEHIAKADVMNRLHRATRKTGKRSYRENKGSHSFMILAKINPTAVESAVPSARVLLDVLRRGGPARR